MTAFSAEPDLATLHTLMTQATREAGEAIMHYYRPGESIASSVHLRDKCHNNPLTQADLEADTLLRHRLLDATPHFGWLSEETVDHPDRLSKQWTWVVDPIDGTKEFITGLPQFAISVALVNNGKPVAACIYNQATQELYTAIQGDGDRLNDQPIQTSSRQQLMGASCLASRSETQRGEWQPFLNEWQIQTMGSIAYKLALVASGHYDMTFTLTPKNEWDFCAGTLLIQEAGGQVSHKNGEPFCFNQIKPGIRALLATNGSLHAQLLTRLKDVPFSPDRH